MRTEIIFVIPAIILCAASAQAGVYKQVDEDGNVIYSDVPEKAGAKPIKPPPIMTIKPVQPPEGGWEGSKPANAGSTEKGSETTKSESASGYASLQITNPANDQAIRANGGSFDITVNAQPGLDTGSSHRFVVLVDGKKHQESTSGSITLTNMNRGTHSLTAQVQDKNGNILANSNTVVVHILRAAR